jgi:hypothetical protein
VLHMQPVVSASCMWLKTVLYLGRLLLLFGILLSPMILPYESVSGPGKSNLLCFFTGCCLGQYPIFNRTFSTKISTYPILICEWY